MGRKRARAWEYIHLCITGLIFFSLVSCAIIHDGIREQKAHEYLLRGHQLFGQRSYDGALREYQKVLSIATRKSQEAEALFHTGLIYTHFGYPKKNYGKSLHVFVKILNDYPESPLVEQARVWVGVLQEHERLSKFVEKSKQTVKGTEKITEKVIKGETKAEEHGPARVRLVRGQKLFAQGNYEGSIAENQKVLAMSSHRPPEDEALFNLGINYAHFGNPKRDYAKSLDYFKRLIKDYAKSPLVEQAKMWIEVLQENDELNQVIQKLKQVDIEVEEKKRETAK